MSHPVDGIPVITHSVVFKCIGYTKEDRCQELLREKSREMV